jgi:uncharacterized repeat protein (TIGR03803 family)
MKTLLTTLHNGSKTCKKPEPLPGRKPVLALLLRLLIATALVLPAIGVQAGVVFTSLYSFTGTNDGATPYAELVQGSDGYFYGTTEGGGTNGLGTVFKIGANGELTSLYSFTGTNDGAYPEAGLVQGSDGSFYGTTEFGGTSSAGTVFQISTNGAFTSLCSFGATWGVGANPVAGLVQGSGGNFYGTTEEGGGGYGTVFKISTNGVLTSLYDFISGGSDGVHPYAGLVQGSDGNFYGTTREGGTYGGYGTVFKISTNGVLTTLHFFGHGDGVWPQAGLVLGSDGYFYGTTEGAVGGYGTVFKISTNGVLTTLRSIVGTQLKAELVQGSDGKFYGTTYGGGTSNAGTVFQISTNGAFTSLYSFTGGTDGAYPEAGLVQGSDGSFYGTTQNGGTNNLGTVFRLTILPPQLTITVSGANVILSWPTNATGFTLEFVTNLVSPTVWNTNSTAQFVINGQNVVTNPISGTQMFFRLMQ